MRRPIRSLLLLASFTLMVSGKLASAKIDSPIEMELLVYNTHGLPTAFAKDNPDKRFPAIARLTQRYELSLLQEDFAHHETLLQNLTAQSLVLRGNARRSALCLFCSGSGLTTISNLGQRWHVETQAEAFNSCSGWLGGLNDCFANKGFQLVLLESPSGNRLMVVNTHLDAGRSASDRAARATQLKQITARIRKAAPGEALIVAGDLNLDWQDLKDRALLEQFREDLNLIRIGNNVQAVNGWPILDYIFYRNGRKTTLEILENGEDLAFRNEDGPLSDHPAFFVKFLVQTRASAI